MVKIKCAAPDCENEFAPKMPHSKYCSDRCRWRHSKQVMYKSRMEKGLCPQCGHEMDKSIEGPSYCSKCKKYFHDRYYK